MFFPLGGAAIPEQGKRKDFGKVHIRRTKRLFKNQEALPFKKEIWKILEKYKNNYELF